jgi:hypothetical protein
METKLRSDREAPTDSRTKDVSCWSTDSSAHCLRVEKPGEIHLFPYGYFQHAKLVSNQTSEVLQIRFQECQVIVVGKGLEPLCKALARLAVDCIKIIPHPNFRKSEGLIETIEIREPKLKTSEDRPPPDASASV